MAYNLDPLITILQQILNHDRKRWILDHNKPEIESLLEKASSLKQILQISSPATESLEREIRDAAHKAEDIIESHMLDEMLTRRGGEISTLSVPGLQQVINELDSATEKAMKLMDDGNQMADFSSPSVSFSPDSMSFKNIVVGLDEDLIRLQDRLTGPQSKLEIIPIVGLGGIDLPSAISRLWNLQTLIVRSNLVYTDMPSEVWEMSYLRHVKFKNTVIWIESRYRQTVFQEKLQTISSVNLYELIESGFLESIPNIKSLGISCEIFPPSSIDLSHLRKLETLKCSSNLWLEARTFLSTLRLPPSVRKLVLSKCGIPLGFMETLCALPNLVVLKIRKCVFESRDFQAKDEEWEATERGEFRSLEFLLLENLNLVRWRTDESKFPRLLTPSYMGLLFTRGNPLWNRRNTNT